MKIAIVHEWFVNYAGSEKVVEKILECYPDADLFALVDFLPDDSRKFIMNKKGENIIYSEIANGKEVVQELYCVDANCNRAI